ncbi:hypothetical protein PP175_27780 (plasmid) [Aneurinibacillus sp. Ricciae_BoGa-3]|uniref:hypothetical protein n=1 Tax=Aneurinibacillus sp. Ricciae_BoGa-3 TaxID=3022697 RepID=UPI0023420D4D|nr:hypothetical protein [Aneurinibacillus sp. Ricciae_BoGa-3]WCK56994.1 hypothetical protein PP175_27780 [Aneurinibacillus sp. Ricciae_BoGa-3]
MNMEVIKALARCRIIELEMAQDYVGATEQALDEAVEKKWLAKEIVKENGKIKQYYTLTTKGEQFIKENLPEIKEIYRGFILEHDLNLMAFYLKRSKKEQDSWMTRDDLTKTYQFPGTVDGAFINKEGEKEAVEVMSTTAKPSSVEKTEAFVQHAGITKMNYILYTQEK